MSFRGFDLKSSMYSTNGYQFLFEIERRDYKNDLYTLWCVIRLLYMICAKVLLILI